MNKLIFKITFFNNTNCFSILSVIHSSSESRKAIQLYLQFFIPKFLAKLTPLFFSDNYSDIIKIFLMKLKV